MEGVGDLLRRPLAWGGVLLAGAFGVIMTFSYLGGFLDPTGHLEGLRVAVVNEDRPVEVAGTAIDGGTRVVAQLRASDRKEVTFVGYDSYDDALEAVHTDRGIGVVRIPEGFSAAIGDVGLAAGAAEPAHLEMTTNDGAGLFQSQVFARVIDEVDTEVNQTVNGELVDVLAQAGLTIDPAAAGTIGAPVRIDVVDEVSVQGKTGRGLAPFYTAIMVTLTGFLAASITSLMVEVLRGEDSLELLGDELEIDIEVRNDRPLEEWVSKAILATAGACLGGLGVAVVGVWILGMPTAGFAQTAGLAALGATAIALVTLVFLTLFGIGGELLGVLFTTIFGVPSALGVYPVEALPPFFRFVSSWHPMHYATDGFRALVFYDGRADAGLGRAVVVLALWALGGLVVGFASAWWIDRRGSRIGERATSAALAEHGAA